MSVSASASLSSRTSSTLSKSRLIAEGCCSSAVGRVGVAASCRSRPASPPPGPAPPRRPGPRPGPSHRAGPRTRRSDPCRAFAPCGPGGGRGRPGSRRAAGSGGRAARPCRESFSSRTSVVRSFAPLRTSRMAFCSLTHPDGHLLVLRVERGPEAGQLGAERLAGRLPRLRRDRARRAPGRSPGPAAARRGCRPRPSASSFSRSS